MMAHNFLSVRFEKHVRQNVEIERGTLETYNMVADLFFHFTFIFRGNLF